MSAMWVVLLGLLVVPIIVLLGVAAGIAILEYLAKHFPKLGI